MLLTLQGLADRWGMSVLKVKELVRKDETIPFIELSTNDERVNWKKVRFRLAAIEAWESEHQKVFKKPKQPALAMPVKSLLGNWR